MTPSIRYPTLSPCSPELNYDLVEMVLADEDTWDRYAAAQWLNIRRFLDANPDDPLAGELRDELETSPQQYVRFQRPWLGWGVFASRLRADSPPTDQAWLSSELDLRTTSPSSCSMR